MRVLLAKHGQSLSVASTSALGRGDAIRLRIRALFLCCRRGLGSRFERHVFENTESVFLVNSKHYCVLSKHYSWIGVLK